MRTSVTDLVSSPDSPPVHAASGTTVATRAIIDNQRILVICVDTPRSERLRAGWQSIVRPVTGILRERS